MRLIACHCIQFDLGQTSFELTRHFEQGCFCQVVAKSPTWGLSECPIIQGGCPFSKFQIEFWEHESQRQRHLSRQNCHRIFGIQQDTSVDDTGTGTSLGDLLARDRVRESSNSLSLGIEPSTPLLTSARNDKLRLQQMLTRERTTGLGSGAPGLVACPASRARCA